MIRAMSFIVNLLVNLRIAFSNLLVRLFGKLPNYVWMDVRGNLPEFERRVGFIRKRLNRGTPPPSLEGFRRRFRLLTESAKKSGGPPPGVVLRIRGLQAGWASLEELQAEIRAYRDGGGKVVAYLIEGGVGAYYLASAADEIIATPVATLDVTGVRTSVTFLKDALDRAGIETEVVAVSPYKTAFDRFSRNDFSEEARAQAERLLDGRYTEFVRAVSKGRNLSGEEVERLIDEAPFGARRAVENGLLDSVAYEDELPKMLGKDEKARLVEWEVGAKSLKKSYRRRAKKRVGVVSLSGAIVRGTSRNLPIPVPLIGGEQAGDETVVGALRAAERDRRVSSVLFVVDSGGGDALASDLIWREVERIDKKKPVVVLMGNVAASGGYYVGAAARRIFARRNTVTGSIGVITLRPVAGKLLDKLGLNPVSLQRGARAGLLDFSRPPTDDEMDALRGQISSIYDEFRDRVTKGRGMDLDSLEEIAGGRVWSGVEAKEIGLVDGLGGFDEALAEARKLGEVGSDGPESIVWIQPPKGVRPAPGEVEDAAHTLAELLGGESKVRDALAPLVEVRPLAVVPFRMTDG